jgi:hypothetical protein
MAIFKFTEARIRDLALGSGIHRDTDVKGLLCICHKTTKTFACQGDVRRDKRLVRTVRVKIGRTDLVRLTRHPPTVLALYRSWRNTGKYPDAGPDFFKVGKAVFYTRAAIDAYNRKRGV